MSKKLSEMKGSELVAEYNRLAIPAGKKPIKRFATTKDAIKRIEALSPKGKKKAEPKQKKVMPGICGEFGCREGTNRASLVSYLGSHLEKEVAISTLIKEVYGKDDVANKTALMMVLKGARVMIKKSKLPYEVSINEGKVKLSRT